MKIGFLTTALALGVFFAIPALAQGLGGTINGGLGFGTIVGWGTQDLRVTIMRVIQILFGFLGVVAIAVILYAGWLWMTSGGDPQKIDRAKRILVEAVIGLLVIFSAFAIVSFVIRSLTGATGPQGGGPGSCAAGQYWCPATSSCVNLGDPCGFGGAGGQCVAVGSPTSPPKLPMNSVVRAVFNVDPDVAADATNFKVQLFDDNGAGVPSAVGVAGNDCSGGTYTCHSDRCTGVLPGPVTCDGDTIPGAFQRSGRVVEFTPDNPGIYACPGYPGLKCFRQDAIYKVELVTPALQCGSRALSCDPAVFCSDPTGACGAVGDRCGTGGFCRQQCVWFFETNDKVDITAPTVNLVADKICQDVNQTIAADYTDDAGVDWVRFFSVASSIELGMYDPTPPPASILTGGRAQITLDFSSVPLGAFTVRAEAQDFDAHSARNELTYQVRPAFCCDGTQNGDETGTDCGGSCGSCAGANCDIDRNDAVCQPNPAACAFACSSTSCLCVDPPFIDYVSPARDAKTDNDGDPLDTVDNDQFNDDVPFGAVGNLVTIIGRNFGSYVTGRSKVEFWNTAGAGSWVEAKLANDPVTGNPLCGSDAELWKNDQIVVVVPALATDGPIHVTTADGLDDTTNNAPRSTERQIPNFVVDPAAVLPGICVLNPASGVFKDPVIVRGIKLDRGAVITNDFVKFGGHIAALSTLPTWDSKLIDGVAVPSIVPGPVRAWVELDAGAKVSNTLGFQVLPGVDHPVILDFNPMSGAEQDYVTILGANFGSRQGKGTVKFCKVGCTSQVDGNFVFPNQCGGNIWSNSRILVKVPAGAQTGKLEVITDGDLHDSTTDTNGPDLGNMTVGGTAGPGICKIEPDNGPAGEARVRFFGERFVKAPPADSQAQFSATVGTVAGTAPSVTLSIDDTQADILSVVVPGGAVTGDVRVANPGPVLSNPLPFTVNDCRSALACTGSQECCAVGPHAGSCAPPGTCGGVTLASSYRWYFLTGKAGPRVVQQCTRSLDCSSGGFSSPTPLDFRDGPVPVNSKISASFDRLLDKNTVSATTVMVEDCGPASGALACVAVPTNLVNTVATRDWSYGGVPAHWIEVSVNPVTLGQPFQQNRWYRVTLTKNIRSPSGEQIANGDPSTGNFVWTFRTRDDTNPGTIGCLGCDPKTSPPLSAIDSDNACAPGVDCQPLTGTAYSAEQACVPLDPTAYNWSFASDDPLRVAAFSTPLTTNTGVALAKGDTPGVPVRVKVAQAPGKDDICRIAVSLGTPVVVDHWPSCNSACVNAELGAAFSLPMNDDTVADPGFGRSVTNPANVKLYVCGLDYTCTLASSLEVPLLGNPTYAAISRPEVTFQPAASHNGVDTNGDGVPDTGRLIAGVYYRAVLSGNIQSFAGKGLGQLNFDTDGNGSADSYSWVFKVRENFSACEVGRVDVQPSSVTTYPPSLVQYQAVPRSTADECSSAGQRINPYGADWSWNSTNVAVATLLTPLRDACGNGVIEPGEECDDGNITDGDGCSGHDLTDLAGGANGPCVEENDPQKGSTQLAPFPVCGNGMLENNSDGVPQVTEEQCDDGNTADGDGCSRACLLEGTRFGQSRCGDGIVGPGESCEVCTIGGALATIYRDSCAGSDLALNRTPDNDTLPVGDNCRANCTAVKDGAADITGSAVRAPLSVCGNAAVESGEECDTGIGGLGTLTDGCTDTCINTGSVYELADPPNVGPRQLAQAAGADGVSTIRATYANGVFGTGIFTVPSPAAGGTGPFQILSKQPSGDIPACLNEVVVVSFSTEPDITTLDGNIVVTPDGSGVPGARIQKLPGTNQVQIRPPGTPSRWQPETTYSVDLATNKAAIKDVGGQQLKCDPTHVCTWTFHTGKIACRAVDLDVSPSFTVVKPDTDTNPPYLASLLGASRSAAVVSGITALGGGTVPRLVNFLGCSADANVCVSSADGAAFTISATSDNLSALTNCTGLGNLVAVEGLRASSAIGGNGVVDLGCGVGFDFSGAGGPARSGNWWFNLDPAYRAVLVPDVSFKWNYTQVVAEPAVEDDGSNTVEPTCVLRDGLAGVCQLAGATRDEQYLVHGVVPWTPFVGVREADIRARYEPDGLSGTARFVVGNLCQLPYRAATRYSIYPLQADANTLAIGHFDGTARLLLGNGTPLEPKQQSGLTYRPGLTDGGGKVLVEAVTVDALDASGNPGSDQLVYPAQDIINPASGSIALWFRIQDGGARGTAHSLVAVGPAGSANLKLFYSDSVGKEVTFVYGSLQVKDTLTAQWAAGEWHLVVASWELDGQMRLQLNVDGRAAVRASGAPSPFVVDGTELRLGTQDGGIEEADGAFDELELSTAVLSDEEIEARYEAVAARCISGAGAAGTPQVSRCTPTGDASGATCTDVTTPISCSSPLISVTFSQPMDRATLLAKDGNGEYVNVLLCTDADYTAGSTCTPANNVIEELQYNQLVNQLQVERPAGLTAGLTYHVVLKAGPDKILGESGLPLSSGGVGDFHWEFAIAPGAGRCQCNEAIVSVAPPSPAQPRREDAFSCAGSSCLGDQDNTIAGNQHVYRAQCFDRAANQPTASVNYLWRKDFDVAGILKLACTEPSCTSATTLDVYTVTASNTLVDGAARISVIATGIAPTEGSAQGFLDVSNFVCSNPWPDPWNFPFQDTQDSLAGFPVECNDGIDNDADGGIDAAPPVPATADGDCVDAADESEGPPGTRPGPQSNKLPYTNFELFYCRDVNETEDANDDLPPLETQPTVRVGGSLPKQFLFPLNYFQGSDAIQVVAGATSNNVGVPRGPLSNNPEFGAAYQDCQTYTAETVGPMGGQYKLTVLKAGHYQVAFEVVHFDTDFEPPSQVSIAIDRNGDGRIDDLDAVSDRNRDGATNAADVPEQHQRLPSLKSRQAVSFDLGQQAPGDVTVALRYEGDDATQNLQEEFAICRAALAVANIKNDVIGVQVRENPFRLSPATWYRSGVCRGQTPSADPGDLKGLCFADADCPASRCDFNVPNRRGAPASLAVDGYPAVRDGRTVYVGATNLAPLDNGAASRCSQTLGTACTVGAPLPAACTTAGEFCVPTVLYANIYLISYNEGAGEPTEQIFSALLDEWKFNAGLVSLGACGQLRCSAGGAICADANTTLKCSDGSTAVCTTTGDPCNSGAGTCLAPSVGDACSGGAGTCGNIACSSDLDCPGKAQDSCLNPHDKIRRDAIRYGQLQDLQLSLRAASNRRGGTFPLWDAVRREFTGGTYVPGYTFSTWPSWGKTFGSQLGAGAPVDPINQFIGCPPPYHRETCWDEQGLRFGCPPQAYVYGYQVDGSRQGSGYTLSTRFEFPAADGGWRGNDLVGNACFNYLARGAGDRDGDGVMDVADNCQQKSNPYVCKDGPKLGEPCPDGPTGTECGVGNECWQPDADDISGINLARKYGIIPDWFAIGGKWYTSPCQAGGDVRPEFTINGDRYNRNETYCTNLTAVAPNNPFWLGELTTIFDYDTVDVYAFKFSGPIEICGTDDINLDPANITCWPPVAFQLVNDPANPLFDAAAPADAQSMRLTLPQRVRFRYLLINRTVPDTAFEYDRIQEVEVYNNSGGDGFGDVCDPCQHSTENDIDHDGVCENGLDNPQYGYRPDNCTYTYNPDQRDSNGVGGGDACDTTCTADLDRDGDCDARDNCPTVYNPGQENVDGRDNNGTPGGARRFCAQRVTVATVVHEAANPNAECTILLPCKDTNGVDTTALCQTPDQIEGQIWPNGTEWGDACDLCSDVDHDGWGGGAAYPAESCRPDNCRVSQNPGQEDFDRDGQGYLCDECIDSDNDRLTDQLVGNSSFEDGLNGWQLFKQAGVDAHLRQATDYLRLQDYFPSLNHDRAYRGVHSAEILIQNMQPLTTGGTNRYLALRTVANPSFLYTAPNYGVRYVMQALVKPSDPQMVPRLHFRPILGCTGFPDGRAVVNGLEYKARCGDMPDFDDEASPPNPVTNNNQGFRLPLLQPLQRKVKDLGNGWHEIRAEFAFAHAFRNDQIAFELALELEDSSPVSFSNNASLQVDDFQVSFLQANAEESCKRVGWPPLGYTQPGEVLIRPLDNCRTLNNPTRCVGGRYHGSICNTSLDCISPVRRNVKAVTVFEHSGAVKSYTFDAVSDAKLTADIADEQALATAPTPGAGCDIWTTQGECFDLFWSDAAGALDATMGTFLTLQAWRAGAADMGHNLDAVRLELVSGAAAWATSVSNVGSLNPDPLANNVLGPTNGQYTVLGNDATSLTLDFGLQRAIPTFASCKEILEAGAATQEVRGGGILTFSHEYGLDLDRNGTNEETVFCDMETDGGGWTLVARMQDDADPLMNRNWVREKNAEMPDTWWFKSFPAAQGGRLGIGDYKAKAFDAIPLADLMVTVHPDSYSFSNAYTPGSAQEIYAVWRNGIGDGTNPFARQPVWKAGYCPAYDPEATGQKSGSRGTVPAPQTQARQCSSRPTLVATDDSSANGDLIVVVERFSPEDVNLANLKLYTNTKTGIGDDTRVNVPNVHSLYLRNWHRIAGTDPAMVKATLTFNNSNVTILGWAIDEDVSGTVQNRLNSTFSVTGGSMWPGGVSASDNGKFERTEVACQPSGTCNLWNDPDWATVDVASDSATFNSIVVGDEADDARLLFTYNPADITTGPVILTMELATAPVVAPPHDYLQGLVVCDEEVSPTGGASFSVVISEPVDPVHGIVLGPRDSNGPAANTCVKNGEIFGIGNQLNAWVEGDAPEISVIGFASGNDPANPGPQGLGNWTDGGAGQGTSNSKFYDFQSIANFGGLFPPAPDPGNYGQLWFRERPVFTGVPGTLGSTGVSTLGVCLQPDYDEDNVGDACDRCTDRDFDRFGDAGFTVNGCAGSFFKRDNCPATYNPDQADYDNDASSCRYDVLQPYITAGSPLACNDALGFPLGGSCQFCGGDACDLDADSDVCYNWDRLKRQAGHGDNQRLPTGEIVAGLSVPNYRLYREEGYAKTLTHDEVTWRSASRDADVDGIADDCDAQACGNAEVENVRRPAPLRTLPGLEKIVVYEVSDCTVGPVAKEFSIGSDKLLADINQDDALFSRNGLTTADCDIWIPLHSKCYDVFFSHRDGQANIDGGYLTVQSVRPPIKACLMSDYPGRKAVNLNIDAVKLDFGVTRPALYVTEAPLVIPGVAYDRISPADDGSSVCSGAAFQMTKAQTDWQNALGPQKLANCSDSTMQYTAGGEGSNVGFTFGFNTESVVNQCFDPVSGVQTCEQCDLNNFTVGSSCDKPFAVGSSATYRQIYPLQLNSNVLFLAHYDGKLDAKRGDGSTVDLQQPPTDPSSFGYMEGLSDGSLDSSGNPIALGNSVEFKLGGKLVYQDGAGGNSLFAGGSNSRSLSVWVNVRNRVDRLTLFDFAAATINLGTAWQAGTWHHIAMTWTATDVGPPGGDFRFDNIRLYLDGLLHDLSFLAAEKAPPPNLDVGWWMWVVGLGGTSVWIDELEFRNDLLTADVIGARVSAIRQHCLAQASRDISRYMVENFCASCNNLRCQINNLRTCMPLDEFSFSSGSAGASSELAKPENRADTLWSLYYSDTPAVRSANGLEIHGIVATEGVAGKAIGTSLGMVDDKWGWAASNGNEADLSVFIDSPNDGHPPAAGTDLGLRVWGVGEDEKDSGGDDEGVIVEVKLDVGGNATKERRCPAGRGNKGVSRTAADLYGNNWSLMDNGSWILMHYARANDLISPGVGVGGPGAGCADGSGHVYGLNVSGVRKLGIDDKNHLWVLVNNGVLRLDLDWVYAEVARVEGTRQDINVTHDLTALTCQMKFGAKTENCQIFNTPAAGEFAFDKDNNLWIAKWWPGPPYSKSDNSQVIYQIASDAPSNRVTTHTFPQVREPMFLTVDAKNSLWVVNNEYVPGSSHKTCTGVIDKIGSLKKSLVKIPLDTLQPTLTVCLPQTTNYGIAADSAGYLWAKNTPRDVQRYDVLDGDSVGLHTLPSGGVYSEPGVRPEIRTGLSPRIIQVIQEERFVDVPVDFSAVASAAEQWQNRWGKILYRVDPAESADRVVALVSLADDAARLGERWITVEEFNDHIGSAPLIGFDDYVNRPTDGEITGRYMRLRFRFPVTMRGTVTVRGLRITCRDGDRQICGQR